jgi:ankyrin repeat protein
MVTIKKAIIVFVLVYVPSALGMHPYGAENLRRQIKREKNNQLLEAARDGNLALVRGMLEEGAEINARRDISNSTPLMLAAINGREQVCKFILEQGTDMDMHTNEGVSPLMIAALRGHEDICRMLIQAGANINMREVNGCDAFYGTNVYPRIRRMLRDRQERLHDSIIVTLGCLRRLKQQGNQVGQLLYTNADALLKSHLSLEKNYKPKRLAKMNEVCRREDRIERWAQIKFCFLIGIVAVITYLATKI